MKKEKQCCVISSLDENAKGDSQSGKIKMAHLILVLTVIMSLLIGTDAASTLYLKPSDRIDDEPRVLLTCGSSCLTPTLSCTAGISTTSIDSYTNTGDCTIVFMDSGENNWRHNAKIEISVSPNDTNLLLTAFGDSKFSFRDLNVKVLVQEDLSSAGTLNTSTVTIDTAGNEWRHSAIEINHVSSVTIANSKFTESIISLPKNADTLVENADFQINHLPGNDDFPVTSVFGGFHGNLPDRGTMRYLLGIGNGDVHRFASRPLFRINNSTASCAETDMDGKKKIACDAFVYSTSLTVSQYTFNIVATDYISTILAGEPNMAPADRPNVFLQSVKLVKRALPSPWLDYFNSLHIIHIDTTFVQVSGGSIIWNDFNLISSSLWKLSTFPFHQITVSEGSILHGIDISSTVGSFRGSAKTIFTFLNSGLLNSHVYLNNASAVPDMHNTTFLRSISAVGTQTYSKWPCLHLADFDSTSGSFVGLYLGSINPTYDLQISSMAELLTTASKRSENYEKENFGDFIKKSENSVSSFGLTLEISDLISEKDFDYFSPLYVAPHLLLENSNVLLRERVVTAAVPIPIYQAPFPSAPFRAVWNFVERLGVVGICSISGPVQVRNRIDAYRIEPASPGEGQPIVFGYEVVFSLAETASTELRAGRISVPSATPTTLSFRNSSQSGYNIQHQHVRFECIFINGLWVKIDGMPLVIKVSRPPYVCVSLRGSSTALLGESRSPYGSVGEEQTASASSRAVFFMPQIEPEWDLPSNQYYAGESYRVVTLETETSVATDYYGVLPSFSNVRSSITADDRRYTYGYWIPSQKRDIIFYSEVQCPLPKPSPDFFFYCLNGGWIFQYNATTPPPSSISAPTNQQNPSTSPVIIISQPVRVPGDFNVGSITFQGLSNVISVSGCASIPNGEITINLSDSEIESLFNNIGTVKTKTAEYTLISSQCISGSTASRSIKLRKAPKSCQKISAKLVAKGNKINAVFTMDNSGCNLWWIILCGVIGALLLIAVVVLIIVFTLAPCARHAARPFSKRSEQTSPSISSPK